MRCEIIPCSAKFIAGISRVEAGSTSGEPGAYDLLRLEWLKIGEKHLHAMDTLYALCGLIIEIVGQSHRQRRHREYGAIQLVEMGGSYRQREKMIDQLSGFS